MRKWISVIVSAALLISMLSGMLVPVASAENSGVTATASAPFAVECELLVDVSYTAAVAGAEAYYSFTPTPSDYYSIDYFAIESTGSVDATVSLYDAYGNRIAYNDDGGESLNFLLSVALEYGETYYYGVSVYGGGVGSVPFSITYSPSGDTLEDLGYMGPTTTVDPSTTDWYETTTTDWYETTMPTEYTTTTTTTTITTTTTTTTTRDPGACLRLSADSLLPASAAQFTCVSAGGSTLSVSAYGDGYMFTDNGSGWPNAYFADLYGDNWITTDPYGTAYLNWDIEVVSGAAAIVIYFAGSNPQSVASTGSYISLNGLINADWFDPNTGDTTKDIPVGTYRGSVPISELAYYYDDDLRGGNGEMYISGVKVFAVGGTVIVNDLSVTDESKGPFADVEGELVLGETYTINTSNGTVYYSFTPTVSGYYDIEPIGGSYLETEFYYSNGEEMWSDDRYFGAGTTYYVGIYSYYTASASFCLIKTPFAIEGTLYDGGSFSAYVYKEQRAYYAFTPSVGGVYTIEATCDLDSKVYLYNAAGTQLTYDDDSGEGYSFKLSYNLTAGETYYYGVSLYDSSISDWVYFVFYNGTTGTTQAPTTTTITTTTIAWWDTTTAWYPTTTSNYDSSTVRQSAESLLPVKMEQFVLRDGGEGSIAVSYYYNGSANGGTGYQFSSNQGWPCAYFDFYDYEQAYPYGMIETNYNSGDRLYWDFEVLSGATNILVYFCGQNPEDMASEGAYVSINGLIDPSCLDEYGNAMDLPVGRYVGSMSVRDIGYGDGLLGANGEMLISGFKVFAVSGTVIINDLSVKGSNASVTTVHPGYNTTAKPVATTTAYPGYNTTAKTTCPPWQHSSVTVMPVVPSTIDVTPAYVPSERQSILPPSASDFTTSGDWWMDVTAYGEGYRFSSYEGWPNAYYAEVSDPANMIETNYYAGDFLYWDFEVLSGSAKILVYFAGQNPRDMAAVGSFVCINGLVYPDWVDPATGDTYDDLPVGYYQGAVPVSELGYSFDLMGDNGEMLISGVKVYAVGGDVIVHDLSVGGADMGYDVAWPTVPYGKDTLYYTVNTDGCTVTITGAVIYTPGIRIPSLIDGKKVTAIGDGAFSWCDRLYSVEIPSTVTSIGASAFYGCYTLSRVVLNSGVTYIGGEAFYGCDGLSEVYYSGSPYQWDSVYVEWMNENLLNAKLYFDTAPYKAYPDVPKGTWYYGAVDHVSNYGFITGYANGSFGPSDNLQRQDFVMILARIAGADLTPYQNADCGLSDVQAGSYYAAAVAWAVDNGIITGYQNGEFGVGDAITREQVCTILYRYSGMPPVYDASGVLGTFPDYGRVSSFATDAMAWAVQNGVISGMQSGEIAPTAGASRAQIATIVMRMDNNGLL